MRRTWYLCFSVTLTATALTSGCTTPTLSGPKSITQALTKTPSANAASLANTAPSGGFNTGIGSSGTPTDPYGKMPPQLPAPSSTPGGVALASLLQAGKSVSNALKIQPKTSSAIDPVKLDNLPENKLQAAADLHYTAGYFNETQKNFAGALRHYREVLDKFPTDVRATAGYGRVQDQLGNTVEAEQYLRRACELAPRQPTTWNDLAHSYYRRKNLGAAISCQQEAVNLQPNNPQYRASLARFLVDVDRSDEAVQQLAAVHGEAMAHFQVGSLLDERRLTDLAHQHVQQALVLNPGLVPARQMWDRWQLAAAGLKSDQEPVVRTSRLPIP